MAVVMQNIVYVYNMVDLKLRDIVPTCENPRGLSCFNTNSEKVLLACPDKSKGRILIKFYSEENFKFIEAYDENLACMEMNSDGSILACASDKGTLIRLYNTENGVLLHELRRGIDKANIFSIAFHPTSE